VTFFGQWFFLFLNQSTNRHRLGWREILALKVLISLGRQKISNINDGRGNVFPTKIARGLDTPMTSYQNGVFFNNNRMQEPMPLHGFSESDQIAHVFADTISDHDFLD